MADYAVVFDMDGVIFDSERCVMACWDEIALRHNLGDFHPVFRACLGTTRKEAREIMRKMRGEDFPAEDFMAEASVIYQSRYAHGNLPLKPYVRELLGFLKQTGIPVVLASSTRRETVARELTEAGLIDYFRALVCGDMVSKGKPDPEIYLLACQTLGTPPAEAFAIEDSFNGIRSASSAGLRTLMVPDLVEPTEEIRALCLEVFSSLREVLDYLKAM